MKLKYRLKALFILCITIMLPHPIAKAGGFYGDDINKKSTASELSPAQTSDAIKAGSPNAGNGAKKLKHQAPDIYQKHIAKKKSYPAPPIAEMAPPLDKSSATSKNARIKANKDFTGEQFIRPDTITPVILSNQSVNRIVCMENITDYSHSKEHMLDIKINEKDAFVKFLPHEIYPGKFGYRNETAELYIVCSGQTYGLLIKPVTGTPKIVRLLPSHKDLFDRNLKLIRGMTLEKQITFMIRGMYDGSYPGGIDIEDTKSSDTEIKFRSESGGSFGAVHVKKIRQAKADGLGLRCIEFLIVAKKAPPNSYLYLREKDFLDSNITKLPRAASLQSLRLRPGESTRLFIVESTKIIQ